MSRICLTLAEKDPSVLQDKLERYAGRVRFIEVRIDALEDPGHVPRLPVSSTTYIATCRPPREGGLFTGEERQRLAILSRAAKSGFHWIDLEHDVEAAELGEGTAQLIRSAHHFEGFPPDFAGEFERLSALPGDVAKLAAAVLGTSDLVKLLEFMEGRPDGESRVILGMGPAGVVSRILGPLLGGNWTYVVEATERAVAPGQFSLADARGVFRIDRWNRVPDLYGLVDDPGKAHSAAAAINRCFQDRGVEALAVPLVLDSPESWFEYVAGSRLPWRGFGFGEPLPQSAAAALGVSGLDLAGTLFRGAGGWRASGAARDIWFKLWTGMEPAKDS